MIANIVTGSRFVAAVALLFFAPSSAGFWALYGWCGVSDMVDGTLARRAGSESAAGARLDSAADLAFVIICAVKLLPVLRFDIWLIVWVVAIALCKAVNLVSSIVACGRSSFPHTIANKAAGLAAFVTIPLLYFTAQPLIAIPACAVATFAAIQEGHFIRTGRIPSPHARLR